MGGFIGRTNWILNFSYRLGRRYVTRGGGTNRHRSMAYIILGGGALSVRLAYTILTFLCVWKGGGAVFGDGGINNLIILSLWNVFRLGEIQFRLGEIRKNLQKP